MRKRALCTFYSLMPDVRQLIEEHPECIEAMGVSRILVDDCHELTRSQLLAIAALKRFTPDHSCPKQNMTMGHPKV
jgi:hypothetical protein